MSTDEPPRERVTMTADDLLGALADDAAGLMITDPPWDLDGSGRFDDCASYDRLSPAAIFDTLDEAQRVLADGAHAYVFAPAGAELYEIADEAREHGWTITRTLAWDKGPAAGLGAYRNAFEPILVLGNGEPRTYPGPNCSYPSLLEAPNPGGRTAKPWELYRVFIRMSAEPGDLVVDPYCGTNPLGKAVRRLDREQPWVAGDVVPPEEVALDRRQRRWGQRATSNERGHTDRTYHDEQEQTRLAVDGGTEHDR